MIEQLNQLWPVMAGSHGFLAALAAWRGFLAFAAPIINAKLQAKFTELLVASPSIANDVVNNKWWKACDLILRMCTSFRLPNAESLIVHAAKNNQADTSKNTTPSPTP